MAVIGVSFMVLQKLAFHQSWGWSMGGWGGCARRPSYKERIGTDPASEYIPLYW